MIKQYRSGFTIIEVVLALAITGLMALGAILTVRGSLVKHRYNDGINSFRDLLREQYNSLNNTSVHKREGANYCANNIARGQTDCVVLGRLLRFYNDGNNASKLSITDVIGADSVAKIVKSDAEYFSKKELALRSVKDSARIYNLDWSLRLTYKLVDEPGAGTDLNKLNLYVLIIRSGLSGTIRTYVADLSGLNNVNSDTLESELEALTGINPNYDAKRHLSTAPAFCLHMDGTGFMNKRAVVIRENGANASAVEIAPLDEDVNGIKAVKCR